MRSKSRLPILLVSLGGCSVWTETFPPSPPTSLAETRTDMVAGSVLLTAQCPVFDNHPATPSPRIIPLIAAAAPLIASAVVSISSDYVKQSQTDLTGNFLATGSGQLADAGGYKAQCLIVAHGPFGFSTTPKPDPTLTSDQLRQVGLTGPPDFWLEAKLEPSSDKSQLLVTPVYFRFLDTVARNPGNGTKNIGLILSASHSPTELAPGASAADVAKEAEIAAPFNFGPVKWGTALRSVATASVSDPTNLFSSQTRALSFTSKGGSPTGSMMNISAFVTETSKPIEVETLMADALSSNAKQVSDFISGQITKTKSPAASGGSK